VPTCVVADSAGYLQAASAPLSSCTTAVVLTPVEYANLAGNLWNLSAEDGAVLAVGVVACWSAAFAFRAAIRALDVDNNGEVE